MPRPAADDRRTGRPPLPPAPRAVQLVDRAAAAGRVTRERDVTPERDAGGPPGRARAPHARGGPHPRVAGGPALGRAAAGGPDLRGDLRRHRGKLALWSRVGAILTGYRRVFHPPPARNALMPSARPA